MVASKAKPKAVKPKVKQNQPRHHVGKTKALVEARRKKIIEEILKGRTQAEAGIAAGLNPNSAYKQVSDILQEPSIKQTYCQVLEAAGVTLEAQAKVIKDAMGANKQLSAIIINGKEKDANSQTTDFIEVEDHPTRLRAVAEVHRVRGQYQDKKETPANIKINVINYYKGA